MYNIHTQLYPIGIVWTCVGVFFSLFCYVRRATKMTKISTHNEDSDQVLWTGLAVSIHDSVSFNYFYREVNDWRFTDGYSRFSATLRLDFRAVNRVTKSTTHCICRYLSLVLASCFFLLLLLLSIYHTNHIWLYEFRIVNDTKANRKFVSALCAHYNKMWCGYHMISVQRKTACPAVHALKLKLSIKTIKWAHDVNYTKHLPAIMFPSECIYIYCKTTDMLCV